MIKSQAATGNDHWPEVAALYNVWIWVILNWVAALQSDCYTEVPLYTHIYKVYVCTILTSVDCFCNLTIVVLNSSLSLSQSACLWLINRCLEPRQYASPPQRLNEITARDKQVADITVDENMRLVFSLDVYFSTNEDVVRVWHTLVYLFNDVLLQLFLFL